MGKGKKNGPQRNGSLNVPRARLLIFSEVSSVVHDKMRPFLQPIIAQPRDYCQVSCIRLSGCLACRRCQAQFHEDLGISGSLFFLFLLRGCRMSCCNPVIAPVSAYHHLRRQLSLAFAASVRRLASDDKTWAYDCGWRHHWHRG